MPKAPKEPKSRQSSKPPGSAPRASTRAERIGTGEDRQAASSSASVPALPGLQSSSSQPQPRQSFLSGLFQGSLSPPPALSTSNTAPINSQAQPASSSLPASTSATLPARPAPRPRPDADRPDVRAPPQDDLLANPFLDRDLNPRQVEADWDARIAAYGIGDDAEQGGLGDVLGGGLLGSDERMEGMEFLLTSQEREERERQARGSEKDESEVEDEEDDPMDGTVSAQRSQQAKLPTPQPPAGLQMPAGSIPVATSAARTMVPPPASSSAGPATPASKSSRQRATQGVTPAVRLVLDWPILQYQDYEYNLNEEPHLLAGILNELPDNSEATDSNQRQVAWDEWEIGQTIANLDRTMPDQIREGLRILGERRQRDRQERHRNAQARENERLAQLIRTVAPAAPATTTSRPATESGARSDALDPAGLPLDRPSRADRGREATIEVKTEGVKRERMAMPPTPPLRRRNLQQQRDDAEFVPRPVRPEQENEEATRGRRHEIFMEAADLGSDEEIRIVEPPAPAPAPAALERRIVVAPNLAVRRLPSRSQYPELFVQVGENTTWTYILDVDDHPQDIIDRLKLATRTSDPKEQKRILEGMFLGKHSAPANVIKARQNWLESHGIDIHGPGWNNTMRKKFGLVTSTGHAIASAIAKNKKGTNKDPLNDPPCVQCQRRFNEGELDKRSAPCRSRSWKHGCTNCVTFGQHNACSLKDSNQATVYEQYALLVTKQAESLLNFNIARTAETLRAAHAGFAGAFTASQQMQLAMVQLLEVLAPGLVQRGVDVLNNQDVPRDDTTPAGRHMMATYRRAMVYDETTREFDRDAGNPPPQHPTLETLVQHSFHESPMAQRRQHQANVRARITGADDDSDRSPSPSDPSDAMAEARRAAREARRRQEERQRRYTDTRNTDCNFNEKILYIQVVSFRVIHPTRGLTLILIFHTSTDHEVTHDKIEIIMFLELYQALERGDRRRDRQPRQPYSISSLSGAQYVQDHLVHPRRCQDACGMTRHGFKKLLATLTDKGLLEPSEHVSAQEILGIGLHVFRHAAGHRQAGITFNRSQETISKSLLLDLITP
ncbi:hypothetical protein HD553DRAFT_326701 [Filobasidium floriforme]|uniref:uncharacterized protein n=1 Tax=Filobasidium floriforme TaxID=5210 RepID=UPI001E8DBBA5|nr:uncharacterized protein HD553DRAFT_326701 [Filobasidium floriforme]KAH8078990.1 hypothetical protein HD553DRAFT_326701 [Filobasidium floriforme]